MAVAVRHTVHDSTLCTFSHCPSKTHSFFSHRHTPAGQASSCIMHELRPSLTCDQTHKALFSRGSFVTLQHSLTHNRRLYAICHSKMLTGSTEQRDRQAPCCQIASDPEIRNALCEEVPIWLKADLNYSFVLWRWERHNLPTPIWNSFVVYFIYIWGCT